MISSHQVARWQAWGTSLMAAFIFIGLVVKPMPSLAHHPFGGSTPDNLFEGLVSGIGHVLIGPDHFAFVVASGLLAGIAVQGIVIPIAFALAGLAGTGVHLQGWDLPAPETCIAASVLIFGILLARKHQPQTFWLAGLAAIAGLFHGYAYGEAIVGAEMTPLTAYLVGFTLTQLAISLVAFKLGQVLYQQDTEKQLRLSLRFAGFTFSGAGAAFLVGVLLG